MIPSEDFVFSQSALEAYRDCPRRFELRFIKELSWPALETEDVLEHEAQIERGEEFHKLLHMHALGVDPESIEAIIRDAEVQSWWVRYLAWQKDHLPLSRWAEINLTTPVGQSLITAKYDVIAKRSDGSFLIVDWKSGRVESKARLARRLQTTVYPFVLATAGESLNDGVAIRPEQIEMIYWFAQTGETVEFQSSKDAVAETEARLISTIDEIAARFEFPMTNDEHRCKFCVYRSLCDRGREAGALEELPEVEDDEVPDINIDDINEIAF